MAEHVKHCPFLNRADDRCSGNFSLDHLQRTFDYCFGSYNACPMYAELLAERRMLRQQAAWENRRSHPGGSDAWSDVFEEGQPAFAASEGTREQVAFVPLTFGRRHA